MTGRPATIATREGRTPSSKASEPDIIFMWVKGSRVITEEDFHRAQHGACTIIDHLHQEPSRRGEGIATILATISSELGIVSARFRIRVVFGIRNEPIRAKVTLVTCLFLEPET